MHSLQDNLKAFIGLAPVAQAASAEVDGSAVDTLGYQSGVLAVQVGATSGIPDSFTVDVKVQDSADGSTGWGDVSGAAITQIVAANKVTNIRISDALGVQTKRYLRAVAAVVFVNGTSPKVGMSAALLLGQDAYNPTS